MSLGFLSAALLRFTKKSVQKKKTDKTLEVFSCIHMGKKRLRTKERQTRIQGAAPERSAQPGGEDCQCLLFTCDVCVVVSSGSPLASQTRDLSVTRPP